MTQSTPEAPLRTYPQGYQPGLHRFASILAGATLLLIVAGGLVTSNDAGLAVPDWPLSYGSLFPQMVGNIRYEHTHRLIAGTVAVMMMVLCVWLWRREPRRWVAKLGLLAVGAVLAQATLGGITVLYFLPKPVSIGHACLAQAFFCLVVSIALFTSREWHAPAPVREPAGAPALHAWAVAAVAVVYLQLILGATVRHFDAALAIPDFPLMLGHVIPPLHDPQVAIHFAHRVGALVVAVVLVAMTVQILRHHRHDARLARLAYVILGTLAVQVTLGALTVLSATAPVPSTLHVAVGAFLLGCTLVLCLRVHRYLAKPALAPAMASVEATS